MATGRKKQIYERKNENTEKKIKGKKIITVKQRKKYQRMKTVPNTLGERDQYLNHYDTFPTVHS